MVPSDLRSRAARLCRLRHDPQLFFPAPAPPPLNRRDHLDCRHRAMPIVTISIALGAHSAEKQGSHQRTLTFFQHALMFDRSSLTRWRQRMGADKLKALLQESLAVATRTEAMKPSDLARVVIDTTVQPKAVMFPTDAKLLNRARERLVRLTKKLGVSLRQSYARIGKLALIKHQRYAHAHQ